MLVMSACSKSKEENSKRGKTVDLGEASADENADKAKKGEEKSAQDKGKTRPNSRRSKAAKDAEAAEKEAYEKNEAARFDEDGKPKRGKPAAEIEFEEKQAAKQAKAGNSKAKTKQADVAEEMDFTDEAETADADANKKEILPARSPKPKNALDIEQLINIRELREQTGYSGALSDAWLLGQPPSNHYNVMRLATDNENQLGFSVQVWKPGNQNAASKRFNDLYQQSFGGKKITSVATDAFTASHHDINELGFFEKSKRSTVLLSCSSKICTLEQLQAIALIIQRRLKP